MGHWEAAHQHYTKALQADPDLKSTFTVQVVKGTELPSLFAGPWLADIIALTGGLWPGVV